MRGRADARAQRGSVGLKTGPLLAGSRAVIRAIGPYTLEGCAPLITSWNTSSRQMIWTQVVPDLDRVLITMSLGCRGELHQRALSSSGEV